tara:strand:+ start:490 stop:813 length:324 start_codon:yes stop_codon:yes gene_type:complete
MDKLFTQTSKVLRDNWVIELQKNNDFLKNKLSNINVNPFFGYKVIIKEHAYGMGSNFISRTNGVIYNLDKANAWILYKNDLDEKIISNFHIRNIEFVDSRFDTFFET